MPVGVLIEAVYCPVWGSTLQLDRNYGCQKEHTGCGKVRLGAAPKVVCVMKGDTVQRHGSSRNRLLG
jgi:hypothetical protein